MLRRLSTFAGRPHHIKVIGGDMLEIDSAVGAPVPAVLLIRVCDQYGSPVSGVSVSFVLTTGGGAAGPQTVLTDAFGRAEGWWGPAQDEITDATIEARVAGLAPVTFTEVSFR